MRNWLLASPPARPYASWGNSSPAPTLARVCDPASVLATFSGVWMTKFSRGSGSAITNPWVEHTVEDVRQKVEQDHESGGDQQVGEHDVRVEGVHALEIPRPEPLPPEDELGQDGPA